MTAEKHARRAIALAGQGRNDEAESALVDALQRWTACYGPDHYEVAVVLHNLGGIELARGRPSAARVAFTRALAIKRAVLGNRHREVAILVDKLAALESA